jgi:hypothetical protein
MIQSFRAAHRRLAKPCMQLLECVSLGDWSGFNKRSLKTV